ncbi:MAG: dihydropteroate synthase [Rikenellaceae bacterium]|nr:dihydropteroate synthase [Rikenellaceae bacterium]
MAIVNVTPDSFYAASRTMEGAAIRERVQTALDEGAAILDVGGYSSRPGAEEVSVEEEFARLARAMEIVRGDFGSVNVSIDTFMGSVARRVIERYGPCIVNDISGGELDPEMIDVVAEYNVPYITMHMVGTPQTMQQHVDYDDVTDAVIAFFDRKLAQLDARGVKQAIIDPGFGFSKTTRQNHELLQNMDRLLCFGRPVLAGLSRKSMIYKPLKTDPQRSLIGTAAMNWEALRKGASILRVHDVKAAADVINLYKYHVNRDL